MNDDDDDDGEDDDNVGFRFEVLFSSFI